MKQDVKKRIRNGILCIAVAAAGTAFLLLFPFDRVAGVLQPWLFYTMTGRPCIGCGATRSVLALARLDIIHSVMYHPLPFLLALAALLHYIEIAVYAVCGRRIKLLPRSDRFWLILSLTVCGYLALRIFIPQISLA